ncbi:hypothetical protein ALQ07_101592 [Pseudomonas syringae pv. actinidiae]|uniref:Uncharacterized protein n=1 Tax=Pseudomonas syringae pv. actinidiae TaxID=103796 RepID=A0A3M4KRE5_PSESF|nr:hypothetical protein ALQ07_101592 [Pseudomonas syringae pv. actinidiae]
MLQKPMIARVTDSAEAAMPEKRQGISAVERQSGKVGAVFLPVWVCRVAAAALCQRLESNTS